MAKVMRRLRNRCGRWLLRPELDRIWLHYDDSRDTHGLLNVLPTTGALRGKVTDAGGGYVTLLVARDTNSYPPDGAEVTVEWRARKVT